VDKLDKAGFEDIASQLQERMRALAMTRPIPYRRQNGGDYLIPSCCLRPELGDPGVGFRLHLNHAAAPQQAAFHRYAPPIDGPRVAQAAEGEARAD
jgi:NAD(P)H dehydrogenase (quinone)